MAKLKVGVLISGRGSNLQALIDAASADDYPAEIAAVISNVPGAAGLERAIKAGLPTEGFVKRWHDRLVNIHPSLLPAFKGLGVHERVIAAGVRFSGCTVQFLRPAMDEGPIIAQAAVPVHAGDDAPALAARVLGQEHRVYPLAVRLIAEGRVKVVAERVVVSGAAAPEGALINPA